MLVISVREALGPEPTSPTLETASDSVADLEEFATDPEVAPARILMRHPQDQLTTLG